MSQFASANPVNSGLEDVHLLQAHVPVQHFPVDGKSSSCKSPSYRSVVDTAKLLPSPAICVHANAKPSLIFRAPIRYASSLGKIHTSWLFSQTLANHPQPLHLAAGPVASHAISLPLLKAFPEPQRLVSGPSNHSLTVRAHGQIENTIGVPRQAGHLSHARVLPNHDLILGVSMGGDQLIRVLTPCQIANLGASVQLGNALARGRIPELDSSIGRSTTGSKKGVLMG